MTETYTAWTALVDLGFIGLLLSIGVFLRARIRFLQNMLVPASVIAGLLGLLLGQNVLGAIAREHGWKIGSLQFNGIPLSSQVSTYSSILIVVVFACMALTDDFDVRKINRSVAGFATYGVLMYSLQVAVGMGLCLLVLKPLFDSPDSIGLMLFTGWAGGFGTAAAVGDVFNEAGDPGMASIAFSSATVGLLAGVIGGIIIANIGARRGQVEAFKGMDSLPQDIRTGILDQTETRPAIGTHTFSGGTVESLTFNVGVISIACLCAYGINQVLKMWLPDISFPLFSISFVVGIVMRLVMNSTKSSHLIDTDSLRSISGMATDILVVCGIASIEPAFVKDHVGALGVLFLIGLLLCVFLGFVVAPRMMGDGWFERQLFTWGWATGAVSTGLALLRIVDPKLKSGTIEQFGYAYIPVVPVEIAAVSFAPMLVLASASWAVVGVWGGLAVIAIFVGIWLSRHGSRKSAPLGHVATLGGSFVGGKNEFD